MWCPLCKPRFFTDIESSIRSDWIKFTVLFGHALDKGRVLFPISVAFPHRPTNKLKFVDHFLRWSMNTSSAIVGFTRPNGMLPQPVSVVR